MPRKLLCASCGKAMSAGPGSLPQGQARCQPCRRDTHGYGSYKRGCRCGVCTDAARVGRASTTPCSECRRPALARGLCSTHYSYWHRREISGEWRQGGWISKSRRLAIYERDGWLCHLCGEPIDRNADPVRGDRAASLDHIVPKSHGGTNADENLATAHRACNSRRGVADVAP